MYKLHTYSIMRLDIDHINEICEDIKKQTQNGISSCPLFCMTLTPEGTPAVNKAEILCQRYDLFRERLAKDNIPSGVLVQASIGHGWKLSEPFSFQKYTDMKDGTEREVVCPYDEGFRTYIYNAMRTIASHSPSCIMVDDDFRLLGRNSDGCGCRLHMERFNALAHTSMTREQLHEILISDGNEELKEIYLRTQKESLVQTAKIMRDGIDSVDKTIPGMFCCVGNNAEFASEIASCLAGEGNPVVVRINNGNYCAAGAKFISNSFARAAAQIAKLKDSVDIILAETDTCPQNRYSTGAMQLHAHYTGTILEGAKGAKQWLTRLHAYEPESGKAYRKILAKYSGFYAKLAEMSEKLTWHGFRIPVKSKAEYVFGKSFDCSVDRNNGWGSCVLERLGLPMYFSAENGGILCLEGDVFLSDKELDDAVKGNLLIASDSAAQLNTRGYGGFIGVRSEEWNLSTASYEMYTGNELYRGNEMSVQRKLRKLVPTADSVSVLSEIYHSVDENNIETLAPGSTEYRNNKGGCAVVFAGSPQTAYNISDAFSFLNYTRKQQMIDILKSSGEPVVYCPGDEEIYFRAATTENDELFAAVFNLGFDPMDNLEIVCSRNIEKINKLMPDGSFENLRFEKKGERYIIDTPCRTLEPVVLLMQ